MAMDRRSEEYQEASVALSARVDVRDLAELVNFWEAQGEYIRTMSQLVAWSINFLCQELRRNNLMPFRAESLSEASRHLRQRGLYQTKTRERTAKKFAMALAFENLRSEGGDPRVYAPQVYKTMHGHNQVMPPPEMLRPDVTDSSTMTAEEIEQLISQLPQWQQDRLRKQKALLDEVERQKKAKIAELRAKGQLAEDYSAPAPVASEPHHQQQVQQQTQSLDTEMQPDIGYVREGMTSEEINEYVTRADALIREKENGDVSEQIAFLREQRLKAMRGQS